MCKMAVCFLCHHESSTAQYSFARRLNLLVQLYYMSARAHRAQITTSYNFQKYLYFVYLFFRIRKEKL